MTETTPPTGLTDHQRKIADQVLDEESSARRHIVVALSGAHAYGFPSPDSDLDLKAIHAEPSSRLLSLSPPKPSFDRMGVIDGVEIDYTSNEIHSVLLGVLTGNGNFIERILGAMSLRSSPEHESLIPIVRRALSRRVHRHYNGFATGQLRELEKAPAPTVKRVLYVLRTAMTGTHLLLTGEVVADLSAIAAEHGFAQATDLIERKRAGERAPLPPEEAERWRSELTRAFATLDAAVERSCLPPEPANAAELEAWLIDLRRRCF